MPPQKRYQLCIVADGKVLQRYSLNEHGKMMLSAGLSFSQDEWQLILTSGKLSLNKTIAIESWGSLPQHQFIQTRNIGGSQDHTILVQQSEMVDGHCLLRDWYALGESGEKLAKLELKLREIEATSD